MSIAELVVAFAAAVALGALVHPMSARCQRGFYVDGVTPAGHYRCHRIPARRYEEDRDQRPYRAMPDLPGEDFEYGGEIYCTGGTVPVVVNEAVVSCQSRH